MITVHVCTCVLDIRPLSYILSVRKVMKSVSALLGPVLVHMCVCVCTQGLIMLIKQWWERVSH